MQIESKALYKSIAISNSVDEDLIKNIGDAIFMEMNKLTKNPPNLILDIRGLGRRYIRKKKTEDVLRGIKLLIADPESSANKIILEEEVLFLERIMERYEVFINKKKEKRKLRYAFEPHLEPPVQQKEVQETSKNNV